MSFLQKGFSLIELLVVVSIVALLSTIAMSSVSSSRKKARDVSFQSTANSVQSSIGVCCTGGAGDLQFTLGGEICFPSSGSTYPTDANLGSVLIERDCSNPLGFSVRLEPSVANDGTIDYALCGHDGCEFIPKT